MRLCVSLSLAFTLAIGLPAFAAPPTKAAAVAAEPQAVTLSEAQRTNILNQLHLRDFTLIDIPLAANANPSLVTVPLPYQGS
ncbi:MAG TPA: hypothetical protein VG711_02285, partial [Phycisphaerales bacterium]|nr:hypothetical protein [Phycisphaerales bacterium]